MFGEVDYRDQDFQEIINIEPTRVEHKEQPMNTQRESDKDERGEPRNYLPRNIFDFYHLPPPGECHPGILQDIEEITSRIKMETDNNDDFFLLLKAIDNYIPATDDPIKHLREVIYYLRSVKGLIKDELRDIGIINLDVLAQEAMHTGNWNRYLKEAERRDNAIRDNSGR